MIGAQPMLGAPMPAPTGMMQPAQPQMIPNPAYAQWAQEAQAWLAEKQKRQQQFEQACALIKSDAIQRFKIDIEADSTIAADEQAEKQDRTEFLEKITPFLEVVVPGLMANPALAPLAKELGMFAIRAFKVSRQLEDAFETAFDQLAIQAKNNPTPPPGAKQGNTKSPMEIQAQAAADQGKLQVEQQGNAVKLMMAQEQAEIERQRLEAQQQKDATELALRGREMVGREALEQARMTRIENQNIKGLV